MCLTVFAYRSVPGVDLLLLSNRDEFFDRPARPASVWGDQSNLIGGRDLRAGGTWLACSRSGRLATLTNVRGREESGGAGRSRGEVVVQFLESALGAAEFGRICADNRAVGGYNVLLWDRRDLVFASNRVGGIVMVEPGIHAFSNGSWQSHWFKERRARDRLDKLIQNDVISTSDLLSILLNRELAPDADLPATGVGLSWERRLSAAFIHHAEYGTRCSTIVRLTSDGRCRLDEFTHTAETELASHVDVEWNSDQPSDPELTGIESGIT